MAKVTSQTTQKVEKGMAGKRSFQAAAEKSLRDGADVT